jgi:phosphoribosylglycinamide formyltransferase-1
MRKDRKIRIAIFASGNGSNAENIAKSLDGNETVEVAAILTNNPKAFVIERAKKMNIKSLAFSRDDFYSKDVVVEYLNTSRVDYIVLAGFLWLIPQKLISLFPQRMINIHPALLPNFGGKGMYGNHVHEAVINSGEKHSGITIHLIDEEYDKGKVLFQAQCDISNADTVETLAEKIHQLEYKYFPQIVTEYISQKKDNSTS